ncbi:hypothetical protein HPP92_022827 [Vanilla planifolia]|uniref:BHLH domain-containing protein n=1 Tax=Vanilla planifolia TaxID=51239 RepID=A0A835PP97_VANPL|nr:hypothetical protein HPP92_022827 [Vanilla planifolia]
MYLTPPETTNETSDPSRSLPDFTPSMASNPMPGYFMTSLFPADRAETDLSRLLPMDRALLASRNHRDAEKRRRERIKSHMDRLRVILSCDPKIDKASLLAKAVERVRDLKQLTTEISQAQLFPTETDEIIVLPGDHHSVASTSGGSRRAVFEASVCCDDRADLLPELIDTLRDLRMKTLRAEMATLGGRVRNVLLLAQEKDGEYNEGEGGGVRLREALTTVVNRPMLAADRLKRRRVADG